VWIMPRSSPTSTPDRRRPTAGRPHPPGAEPLTPNRAPNEQPQKTDLAADPAAGGLSRRLVLLLAVACGAAVANLYYAQPLLHTISAGLGVGSGATALLVTASQVGYAAGLVLIVPLGDLWNRRRLVSGMLVLTSVGLAGAAAAPSLAGLAIALAVVGTTSVVAQILVPFASSLAGEDERGRVVGMVMSGLLIGILLARTFSGVVAQLGGWRLVYALASAGTLVLAAALARALPDVPPVPGPSYGRLLRSVGTLIAEEPLLRRRMVYGALGMAGFTTVWTTLALLLSRPPFSFDSLVVGLFGLAGLAGALAAQVAGRAADSGGGRRATGFFLGAILLGWGLLALGRASVPGLVAGLLVLDLGVQGQHILNQTIIYQLRPDARSRLTTAYMSGNFLAGATASALSVSAWELGGWLAVCGFGATLALTGVVVWLTG
jgi:predicted MFS family arabinose efflux permease